MEVFLIGLILMNVVVLIFNFGWCCKIADCNERLDILVSRLKEYGYKIERTIDDIDDICRCHEDDVQKIKAEIIAKALLGETDAE